MHLLLGEQAALEEQELEREQKEIEGKRSKRRGRKGRYRPDRLRNRERKDSLKHEGVALAESTLQVPSCLGKKMGFVDSYGRIDCFWTS